ncbi:MAG: hypothetical protein A2W26_13380 [Acidobacteria bacterium RBG_16_64_8]|nr:MAG: hypothetical protein A2W26_13380 [Acidobacteria bacterium RBG_16_64_8]
MSRLVIRGGEIASAGRITRADLIIEGGAVLGTAPAGVDVPGAQTIEADGLIVLPGLVDVHCHLRDFRQAHKEDFTSGTAAAAAGGFTSVVAQPNTDPPMDSPEALDSARATAGGRAFVDFGLAALAAPSTAAVMTSLREHGALIVEVMRADAMPDWLVREPAALFSLLESAAAAAVPVAVCASEQGLIDLFAARARASGASDVKAFLNARPAVVEDAGISVVLALARAVRSRLLVRQVTTAAAVDRLREAKAAGAPGLWAEVNPHHLVLTDSDAEALGPWGKVIPPLRGRDDIAALWTALRDGTVDLVGTDHAPHAALERTATDFWSIPAGFPALETTLPLFATAVADGLTDFPSIARWLSEAPARFLGLYPRKGILLPGSDADVVLVDPHSEWPIVSATLFTRAGWTPFEGRRVHGRVVMTLLRGVPVYREGSMCVDPGYGRFLYPPAALS